MTLYRKLIVLLFLIFTSGQCLAASNNESIGTECNEVWYRLSAELADGTSLGYENLKDKWEGLGKPCVGTGLYKIRMGTILFFQRDMSGAKDILATTSNQPTNYRYLGDILDHMISFNTDDWWASENEFRDVMLRKAKSLIENYPSNYEVHVYAGEMIVTLESYEDGISVLEEAVKLWPQDADIIGVYRNLAVAYSKLDRYQTSYNYGNKAYKLDQAISDDYYFMLAMSRASAGIGDFSTAQNALRIISAKYPEAIDDQDFKGEVDFIFEKMNGTEN